MSTCPLGTSLFFVDKTGEKLSVLIKNEVKILIVFLDYICGLSLVHDIPNLLVFWHPRLHINHVVQFLARPLPEGPLHAHILNRYSPPSDPRLPNWVLPRLRKSSSASP